MDVRAIHKSLDSCETELIVVGMFSPASLPASLKSVDEKLHGAISHVIKTKEFEGEWQQFRLISTIDKIPARNILLLGLGKKEDAVLETLRKAAGLSVKIARDLSGITEFATTLHEADVPKTTKEERSQAVAEGSMLGSYQYIKYKTVDKDKIKILKSVTLIGDGIDESVRKGAILGECANAARDLVNEPASYLKPEQLANAAKELESLGVKVTVFDKKEIQKLGMHALLAVNSGSVNEPRFVIMEYNGGGKKKVALVGKGITFDSGGLNIKPDDGMLTMKCDMSGAGVVISTMRAAARLKLKAHVFGVFAATENMPGNDAYKQGDILKTYKGKTIEVAHTDAEGRIILSDALAYTEKNIAPDVMVDLATLTGACVVALGSVCAGVMGKDKSVITHLIDAGKETGERLWELPLFQEYQEQVKSDVADVRNLGMFKREAGAITAAAFLSAFVDKTPWAHLDIAGTSWSDLDLEYIRKGGTGFGVRLLIRAIENWSS